MPHSNSTVSTASPIPDCERTRRIAADHRLQRAYRLLIGKVETAFGIAVRLDVRSRDGDVEFVAPAYAQAIPGERRELLRRLQHRQCLRSLQAGRLRSQQQAFSSCTLCRILAIKHPI